MPEARGGAASLSYLYATASTVAHYLLLLLVVVLVFVAAVADECSLLHSLLALSGHGAVVYIEVH